MKRNTQQIKTIESRMEELEEKNSALEKRLKDIADETNRILSNLGRMASDIHHIQTQTNAIRW